MLRSILVASAVYNGANAALPPGYEDYMFCPVHDGRTPCRKRKEKKEGEPMMVGGQNLYWECYYPKDANHKHHHKQDAKWTGPKVGNDRWEQVLGEHEKSFVWDRLSSTNKTHVVLPTSLDPSKGNDTQVSFHSLEECPKDDDTAQILLEHPIASMAQEHAPIVLWILAFAWATILLMRYLRKRNAATTETQATLLSNE